MVEIAKEISDAVVKMEAINADHLNWYLNLGLTQLDKHVLVIRAGLRRCGVQLGTISVGPGSQSTCTKVCRIGRGAQLGAITYLFNLTILIQTSKLCNKMTFDCFNGVISLIFTFNKMYYYTNTIIITILIQRYVINTESHTRYFLFLFIVLVYFGQEYIDQ